MRLRNIPRAQSVLSQCAEVIKNETEHKGSWQEIFGNSHPIHIEIGMGKGKFLLSLASLHPEINYIGIERYSSVLLRAVEKFQDIPFGTETPRNIRFLCMDAQDIADRIRPRRSFPHLSEFFRSMAEGTPCKEKTDFYRIFCPL